MKIKENINKLIEEVDAILMDVVHELTDKDMEEITEVEAALVEAGLN